MLVSNGLGKAIVDYSLHKDLIVCNLDREKSNTNNENYKEFIGDIADEKFVEDSIDEISKLYNNIFHLLFLLLF